jgi:hypothetical protein
MLWLILMAAGCGQPVDEAREAAAPAPGRIDRLEQRYREGGPATFAATAWEIVAVADSLRGPDPAEAARLALNVYLSSAPSEARFEALRIVAVSAPEKAHRWLELVVDGKQDWRYLPRLRPLLPADPPGGLHPLRVAAHRRFQQLDPLTRISWLVGRWERREDDLRVVEQWLPAVGGVMHGISRTWRGREITGWERLRLEADGDDLVYTALPSGQTGAAFRGVPRFGVTIFANREHDFPQALQYRHLGPGGDLEVVAEGVADGETVNLRWFYRRLGGPEVE